MPDMKCAKWAVDQLGKKHKKPFFMGVGFYRPHVPMYATKKWFDMHPRDQVKLPAIHKDDLSDLSQYAIDLTNLKHVSPPTNGSRVRCNGNTPYSPTLPP